MLDAKPLSNVTILDLTNVLAGPFCCYQLAMLGADVIKIEAPDAGDLARKLGAKPEFNELNMGTSFLAQNAGKRSVTINLKQAQGKKIFIDLAKQADVVVENFRPGVMDKLGVGFAELRRHKPDIIYCAISGFGADGPMMNMPAYDQIIQGVAGVMSITGDAESAPLRVGYPICDTIGGLTAAFAVSSLLAGSRENPARQGGYIDVSMLESTLATMGWVVSNYLIGGVMPAPLGNDNFTSSPSGTFKTAQGLLNIAANQQEQFEKVCDLVGRPELKTDPRFMTRHKRLDNRGELAALLEEKLVEKPAVFWEKALSEKGVPAGCINSIPETINSAQIQQRKFLHTFPVAPGLGCDLTVSCAGFQINGQRPQAQTAPPRLGEHTEEILSEMLGYSHEQISHLREVNAI